MFLSTVLSINIGFINSVVLFKWFFVGLFQWFSNLNNTNIRIRTNIQLCCRKIQEVVSVRGYVTQWFAGFDVGPKDICNLLDKSLFLYSRPKQVRLPLLYLKYHQKSLKALQPTSSATFNYGSETQRIVCSIPSLQRQQRKKTCVFVTHV
mgnify:CR=1 FL=1